MSGWDSAFYSGDSGEPLKTFQARKRHAGSSALETGKVRTMEIR